MLCLRCSRGLIGALKPSPFSLPIRNSTKQPSIRTFTSLPTLRPSLQPFRSSALTTTSTTTPIPSAAVTDLLPKLSSHPGLSSLQVRYAKRNTFSPSHFVRKRRHGFLSRLRTRKGRMTLRRRLLKGRSTLSH